MADDTTEQTEHADTDPEVTEPAKDEPKTFSAEYVSEIRKEAADHRTKAKELATRLHAELVRQTGRLADPSELPFDQAHLDDPDALKTAIDELLTRKPHYAARTPNGNIGQGAKDRGEAPVGVIEHLKTLV